MTLSVTGAPRFGGLFLGSGVSFAGALICCAEGLAQIPIFFTMVEDRSCSE